MSVYSGACRWLKVYDPDPSADHSASVYCLRTYEPSTYEHNRVYSIGRKNKIELSLSASAQKNIVTLSHHSKSDSGLEAVASHFQRLIVAQTDLYSV